MKSVGFFKHPAVDFSKEAAVLVNRWLFFAGFGRKYRLADVCPEALYAFFMLARFYRKFLKYTKTGYYTIPFRDILVKGDSEMRLRELRKKRGISQLKLALDLHTTQNTISRYETGAREPSIKELMKFADYFEVSVDYLLGRTENPDLNR